MNFLRKWIRNLLGFSGRETNGFIILLPLIIVIISAEPVYRTWVSNRKEDHSEDRKRLDSLIALWNRSLPDTTSANPLTKGIKKQEFFRFDPNIASLDEMNRLGFPAYLAKRVVSYRQKGGKFHHASDLRKIYGMDSLLYNSLKAYISIPNRNEQSAKQPEKPAVQSSKPLLGPFDMNEADTATLKSVYGIGTKLAERIVKFRSGLGGFVSLNQLSEIYGLDSVVVNRLKKRAFVREDFKPKKINLNTTTEFEMSAHPYISKSIAKAIVAWRFQHGAYKTVDEIKNLNMLKSEDIVKIIPYLKVEE